MKFFTRFAATLLLVLVVVLGVYGQPGTSMSNPLNAGTYTTCAGSYGSSYNFGPNTSYPNTNKLYYQLVVQASSNFTFIACSGYAQGPNSVAVYLYDSSGNIITYTDPGCSLQAIALSPGTYYAMVSRPGVSSGYIALTISKPGPTTAGSGMANAISAGQLPLCGTTFSDSRNNASGNCLGNNYTSSQNLGQPSDDIFYRFTVAGNSQVDISTCSSPPNANGGSFDSVIHLLDANGNEIASLDDNGPDCSGVTASLHYPSDNDVLNNGRYLPPGTYYAVVEGYSTNSGTIATQLSARGVGTPALQLTASATTIDAGYSVTLTASGACSYAWTSSTGLSATGPVLTVRPPVTTTYTVTGSNNNLSATASVTITVNQNLNYITTNTVLVPGKTSAAAVAAMSNYDNTSGSSATAYAVRRQQTTYLDELGRPMQQVAVQASPGKRDIVMPIVYDAVGRTPIAYLPYTGSKNSALGTNGLFQADALTQQAAFYTATNDHIVNDAAPWSVTEYEASSLNRVQRQGHAGATWQPDQTTAWNSADHTLKFQPRTNTANEVRQWTSGITSRTVLSPGYYAAGQLIVTESKDENGHLVVEYKNKTGQLVLKKVQEAATASADADFLLTQYVYDDLDRLRLVIPPQGTRLQPTATGVNLPNDFVDIWCFRYEYDGRGRVIEKQVPGAGAMLLAYNQRNQVVLTQDGNQRLTSPAQWTFTKYDGLGRVIMTGIFRAQASQSQSSLQSVLNAETTFEESRAAGGVGYTLTNAFPRSTYQVGSGTVTLTDSDLLTLNFYDTYDAPFLNPANGELSCTLPVTQWLGVARGLATGSSVRTLLPDGTKGDWLTTATYYDTRYRPVQTRTKNQLGGVNSQLMTYDFAGNLVSSTTQIMQGNTSLLGYKDTKTFTYEESGKLKETRQSTFRQDASGNFIDQGQILLSKNTYNEIGQPIIKWLHSTDNTKFLQKLDYRYNIRGWLTHINNRDLDNSQIEESPNVYVADLDDPATTDADLFGLELRYDNMLHGGATPQYNGNIAQAMWQTRSSKTKNNILRTYNYGYDAANRIGGAQFLTYVPNYGWSTNEQVDFSVTGITYDGNGNLLTMNRTGTINGNNDNPVKGLLDQLTYSYKRMVNNQLVQSNQLQGVDDGAGNNQASHDFKDNGSNYSPNAPEYQYDPNGNLISDANKGITSIQYSLLNQPAIISFKALPATGNVPATIKYIYSSSGSKLAKQVYQNGALTKTTYYVGPVVFESIPSAGSVITPVFSQTPEGRVLYIPNGNGTVLPWKYEYHLKDHLGSLRFAFRADQDNGTTTQVVAGMEPANAQQEERRFQHVAETRLADPAHARTGDYVARLDAQTGRQQGPSIRLNVKAGDSIRAEVYGRYDRGATTGNLVRKGALLIGATTVSLSTNPTSDRSLSLATRRPWLPFFGTSIAIIPHLFRKRAELPTAYLRYELFNKDSQLVATKTQAIHRTTTDEWQHLQVGMKTDSAGFVRVALINSSKAPAYFDDFNVNAVAPAPYQENHYDPFGLNLIGIEQNETPNSPFQFNGKEKQEDFGLNWTDYGARMFDMQLGRWNSVDPLANKLANLSPYNYSLNNPISLIDPTGEFPIYFMFRRYESSAYFGLPFLSKGDDRQTSPNVYATGRINHFIGIETNTLQSGNPVFYNNAFSSQSTQYLPWSGTATEIPRFRASGYTSSNNKSDFSASFTFNNSGQEPVTKKFCETCTPAIDTRGLVGTVELKDSNELKIFGSINGDGFPDGEAYVYDANGNGINLGDYQHSIFGSPAKDLYGEGQSNLFNFDITVKVDNKGNFTNAYFLKDGKQVPLQIYNNKQTHFNSQSIPAK